ncbi:MAG: two-component system regulatory protein YycI [Bacillaceae bacterium]|nr:two-component system regulatory protein YycI [Bacillaceae bacterium]
MDWSKTKTIFIFTFLILNIFLGYHLVEKRNSSQLDVLTETSIEEKFEVDEITYVDLPKDPIRSSFVTGKSKMFTEEEAEILESEKEQNVTIVDETTIRGVFKEPFAFPENNTATRLDQILKSQILYGDQYVYWGVNPETRSLIYYQKYDGKVIFNNVSGTLRLYLNEENEIESYEQTFIDEMEEMDEPQEVIFALKALENLYNLNELQPGSDVPEVELGYITLGLTASHVLIPTWHILVNDEVDFYVNAFEGHIISKEYRTLE